MYHFWGWAAIAPTPTLVVALPTLSLFPIRRFPAGDIYVWVTYALLLLSPPCCCSPLLIVAPSSLCCH